MATTESALGEWKYQMEHRRGMGHRINWHNPPPPGTELLATFDDPVVVDEIGVAGMVVCTRKSDGHQMAAFPSDLKVPNKDAKNEGACGAPRSDAGLGGCPCCGSDAIEIERDGRVFAGQIYSHYPDPVCRQRHGYRVRCANCGVQTCWWHHAHEAIDTWNKRPNAQGEPRS